MGCTNLLDQLAEVRASPRGTSALGSFGEAAAEVFLAEVLGHEVVADEASRDKPQGIDLGPLPFPILKHPLTCGFAKLITAKWPFSLLDRVSVDQVFSAGSVAACPVPPGSSPACLTSCPVAVDLLVRPVPGSAGRTVPAGARVRAGVSGGIWPAAGRRAVGRAAALPGGPAPAFGCRRLASWSRSPPLVAAGRARPAPLSPAYLRCGAAGWSPRAPRVRACPPELSPMAVPLSRSSERCTRSRERWSGQPAMRHGSCRPVTWTCPPSRWT